MKTSSARQSHLGSESHTKLSPQRIVFNSSKKAVFFPVLKTDVLVKSRLCVLLCIGDVMNIDHVCYTDKIIPSLLKSVSISLFAGLKT